MLPKLYGDKVTQEYGISGDLTKLIADASNRDRGLPKPIDADFEELHDARQDFEHQENWQESITMAAQNQSSVNKQPEVTSLRNHKNAPSTPSNHRKNRQKRSRADA